METINLDDSVESSYGVVFKGINFLVAFLSVCTKVLNN